MIHTSPSQGGSVPPIPDTNTSLFSDPIISEAPLAFDPANIPKTDEVKALFAGKLNRITLDSTFSDTIYTPDQVDAAYDDKSIPNKAAIQAMFDKINSTQH